MANRIEGQVWIGRDAPNVFKYFAAGKEYWGVSASTYVAASQIYKGMILAASSDPNPSLQESVIPAIWPRDSSRVIGIAINDASAGQTVRVLNYGYVKLTGAELANCFTTKSDINAAASLTGSNYYTAFGNTTADGGAGNGWADVANWNGRAANVYWFAGRTIKTSGGYAWHDPTSYPGKLTIATPSGYKPKEDVASIPWADASLNIAYRDLPVIGNVIAYTYDGSNNLTEAIIHVNFSKFSRKVSFEYPAIDLGNYTSTSAETITLRHGLFCNYGDPCAAISMKGFNDADPEAAAAGDTYIVYPGSDSFIRSGVDKRTEVEIASNNAFYYKILGEVSYCL